LEDVLRFLIQAKVIVKCGVWSHDQVAFL